MTILKKERLKMKMKMIEKMMELIKRKGELEKSSTSGRQRNLVERRLLDEWIDFLYEVVKEMDKEERQK